MRDKPKGASLGLVPDGNINVPPDCSKCLQFQAILSV